MTPKQIYNFRKSLDLTQEGFAEYIGVSRDWIIRLESGKGKPSKFLLKHIKSLM